MADQVTQTEDRIFVTTTDNIGKGNFTNPTIAPGAFRPLTYMGQNRYREYFIEDSIANKYEYGLGYLNSSNEWVRYRVYQNGAGTSAIENFNNTNTKKLIVTAGRPKTFRTALTNPGRAFDSSLTWVDAYPIGIDSSSPATVDVDGGPYHQYQPIVPPRAGVYDAMMFEVTVATTQGRMWMGIYEGGSDAFLSAGGPNSPDGYTVYYGHPGRRIVSAKGQTPVNVADLTTTGFKIIEFEEGPTFLDHQEYWMVLANLGEFGDDCTVRAYNFDSESLGPENLFRDPFRGYRMDSISNSQSREEVIPSRFTEWSKYADGVVSTPRNRILIRLREA